MVKKGVITGVLIIIILIFLTVWGLASSIEGQLNFNKQLDEQKVKVDDTSLNMVDMRIKNVTLGV